MKKSKIDRVFRLLVILLSGQLYTVDKLAKILGIGRRTVFRDLKTLKNAGIPLYCEKKTYCYEVNRNFFLPVPNLSKREALALLLLAIKAKDYVHFPFRISALHAAAKIESNLPPQIRQYCNAVLQNISIKPEPHMRTVSIDKIFEQVQQAILKKRIISIHYWSIDKHMNEVIDLCPHQLIYDSGAWYVIGRSSLHKAMSAFKLNYIRELKILSKCFFEEDNFDTGDYSGKAWSMKRDGILYNVKLKFSPEIAKKVTDIQWHSTQTVVFQNDGSAVIEFRVDGLSEIIWWILGYGDGVQVLAPQALRQKIIEIAYNMASKNEQGKIGIVDINSQLHASVLKFSP